MSEDDTKPSDPSTANEIVPNKKEDESNEPEPILSDNEAAALLASLKHKVPVQTTFCTAIERIPLTTPDDSKTQKEPTPNAPSSKPQISPSESPINTASSDIQMKDAIVSNPRKRTHSEMESESTTTADDIPLHAAKSETSPLSDPRSKKKAKSSSSSVALIPKRVPSKAPLDPFQNTDWNTTQFMFIRLTYFNKRKCRRFPLHIDHYALFTSFVEYYFQSLTHCTWHAECDENWIECLDDLNAIRDEYLSATPHPSRPFFLELMIINDSLRMKRVYAPKAVYVDNPYKCKYPPTATTKTDAKPSPPTHVVKPAANVSSNVMNPPSYHPPPAAPYHPPPTQPQIPYYAPPPQPPQQPHVYAQAPPMGPPMQPMAPMAPMSHALDVPHPTTADNGGYHHVTYPHYLSARSGSANASSSSLRSESNRNHQSGRNGHKRSSVMPGGAICPDPTTYLPFAHAGQSTPQMRTLHKIVWVLQHQTKPLTIDAIRQCLPGKKKAQINEIDYLLSSYQNYGYTKCVMLNSRKVWSLSSDAFPNSFWNMQWQRTN